MDPNTPKCASANLDLLRSLAVGLVFCWHLIETITGPAGPPGLGPAAGALGRLGVLLFFIHTSLVLMMSLARLDADGGGLVRRFYIRRVFRIYPLSVLTALAAVVVHAPEFIWAPFRAPGTAKFWSDIFLVQNITRVGDIISPMWTLPFEVQMYALLPFVYLFGKRVNSPLAVLLLGFSLWYADRQLALRFGLVSLMNFAPWFFMGAAAFFRHSSVRLESWFYVTSLVLLVTGDQILFHLYRGSHRLAWLQWALGVTFCFLLPLFREIRSRATKKLFHIVAKYSYGVYLSHMPIMWFCFVKLANKPLAVRALLAAGLFPAIPLVLYHSVEAPFIALGARLAARSTSILATVEHHVLSSKPADACGL